jgi:hypothetical protein
MKKIMVKVVFDIELEVPSGTTEDDIQAILSDTDYHFHYGSPLVNASKEEMVDVDIDPYKKGVEYNG